MRLKNKPNCSLLWDSKFVRIEDAGEGCGLGGSAYCAAQFYRASLVRSCERELIFEAQC